MDTIANSTTTNNQDTLTALVADQVCTKTIRRREDGSLDIQGYAHATNFHPFEVPINNIRDVLLMLLELAAEPRAVVIRGRLNDEERKRWEAEGDAYWVRRRNATFDDVSHRVVMLDLDKVPAEGKPSRSLAAQLIKEHLPPAFHNADCVFQWSSSAGLRDDVISVHLWFWLDRPVGNAELKKFFKGTAVDCALFNRVQAHYIASPIFEGMDDPVPERVGLIEGETDQVTLPPVEAKAKAEVDRKVAKNLDECLEAAGWLGWEHHGYDSWTEVTLALRGAAGPDPDRQEKTRLRFHELSSRYPGYDFDQAEAKWNACSEPGNIGAGSIYHWAREAGWTRRDNFDLTDKGTRRVNARNVEVGLQRMGIAVRYDEFSGQILINGLEGYGQVFQDEHLGRLWIDLDKRYHFRPTKDLILAVVGNLARQNSVHPVLDYLDALAWDGKPRLDRLLVDYMGAADTAFNRAVGALMLIAAVRRVRQPGCKFDELLILQSPQGAGKSSAVAALCRNPDWFNDNISLTADSKVIIEQTRGKLINEIAEMSGINRRDAEHVKAVVSRQVDRARLSYDKIVSEVPRQCIFIGTTNADQFLPDNTGNRRFWPVAVTRIDLKSIVRDRDQLWAEAAAREAKGASIRLPKKLWAAAAVAQDAALTEDPWIAHLREALGDMKGKVQSITLFELLKVPQADQRPDHNARLGVAMRKLGWEHGKKRFGSRSVQCYHKGPDPQPEIVAAANGKAKLKC